MSNEITTMNTSVAVKYDDPSRAVAVASHNQLRAAITRFGTYTDREGKTSTSLMGLSVSLNKEIKKAYGVPREEMPQDMFLHFASVAQRVVNYMTKAMAEFETRAVIKHTIRQMIRVSGESYWAMTTGNANVAG